MLVRIFNLYRELRACFFILLHCRLIHQRVMVQRILFHSLDPEQIAADRLLYHISHIFQVSHDLSVLYHNAGAGVCIDAVCIYVFRHGEIRDQDI